MGPDQSNEGPPMGTDIRGAGGPGIGSNTGLESWDEPGVGSNPGPGPRNCPGGSGNS